jgi:hypothetical protein
LAAVHSKSLLHFPAVGLLCVLVCVSRRTVVSSARNPQRQSAEGFPAIPMIASFSVYQGVEKLATRHRSSRNGSTHCAVLGLTSSANSGAKQGAVNHLLRNPQPHLPHRLGYAESSFRPEAQAGYQQSGRGPVILSVLRTQGPRFIARSVFQTGRMSADCRAFTSSLSTVPLRVPHGNREISSQRPIVFSRLDLAHI